MPALSMELLLLGVLSLRVPFALSAMTPTQTSPACTPAAMTAGPVAPCTVTRMPLQAPLPPWYAGIDTITVLHPGDQAANQQAVDRIYSQQQYAQFGPGRHAFLLTAGVYENLNITVGYYTSVLGVGNGATGTGGDVQVARVESFDGPNGGATCIFWKSAEGMAVLAASNTWAASQASPLRRMHYAGDLWLSEQGTCRASSAHAGYLRAPSTIPSVNVLLSSTQI